MYCCAAQLNQHSKKVSDEENETKLSVPCCVYLKRVSVLVVDVSDQDRAVRACPDVREHQARLDELGDVEEVGAGPRRSRKLHNTPPFVDLPGGVPGGRRMPTQEAFD